MTPTELRDLIRKYTSQGSLRLNVSELGHAEFTQAVQAVFRANVITIRLNGKPVYTDLIVHLRGRMSFLGLRETDYDVTLIAVTPAIQAIFNGMIPRGSFQSAVAALTDGRFAVPPIAQFTMEAAQVSLSIFGSGATLAIASHGGIFDRISVEAHLAAARETEYLAVLHVRDSDARFSRLIPALAPLDSLAPRDLHVLLASAEDVLERLSSPHLGMDLDRLDPGALLVGQLPLEGVLKLFQPILGQSTIPLRMSLGPVKPPDVELRSPEMPDLPVLPGVLTFSRAVFIMRPVATPQGRIEGLIRFTPKELEGLPQLRGGNHRVGVGGDD